MAQTLFDAVFRVDSTQVKTATQDVKDMAAAGDNASTAAKTLEKDAKAVGSAFEEVSFKTAGAKRELIVLAHELSQGNYSRFGGSLLVIAERTGAASLLFSAAGITVLGLGAAVAAVAYDIYKMNDRIDSLNKSMVLTGGYAGVTRDNLAAMSSSLQSAADGSIPHASAMLTELAGKGTFTSSEIKAIGGAALEMARLTGESTEDTAKRFDKLSGSVVKFAEETNNSYHYLSVAQYEHIRQLDEEGKHQDAVIETMGLLKKALATQQEDVGILTAIWRGWGGIIDEVNGALRKTLFPTLGEQAIEAAAKVGKLRAELNKLVMSGDQTQTGMLHQDQLRKQIDEAQAVMDAARDKADKEQLTAAKKASDALINQNAIEASKQADAWHKAHRTAAETEKALTEEYLRGQEALRLAGHSKELDDAKAHARRLAEIHLQAYGPDKKVKTPIENFQAPPKEAESLYENLTKSLERLNAASEHQSELQKIMLQQEQLDAQVTKQNALIDAENAAREKYNTDNKLKSGEAHYQQMRKHIEVNNTLIEQEKQKQQAIGLEVDANRSLDLQKSQYAALDAIVTKYTDTVNKQIDVKHKSAAVIADEAAKLKIDEQLEKDILVIKQQGAAAGAEQIVQLIRIDELTRKASQAKQQITESTKQATIAEEQWGQRGATAFITGLGTMNQGLEKITTQGLQNFSDSLYTLITTGKNGFADMVASMLDQIAKLIFQMYVIIPLIEKMKASMASSGLGGMLGGLFGGGAAAAPAAGAATEVPFTMSAAEGATIGSNNNNGNSILVGEKGPEMFIPKGAGTIVPNAKLGNSNSGGTSITNSFQINVSGATDPAATAQQVAVQVKQLQQLADSRIATQLRPGGMLNRHTAQAF